MPLTSEHLDNWFEYHPPTSAMQVDNYQQIRDAGKEFASTIIALTPGGADQTAAVRKVREAVMTANAAIACEGR